MQLNNNFNIGNELLNTITEVNHQILRGLEHEKILDFIFEDLRNTIPYDRIGVALLEDKYEPAGLKMSWVKSVADAKALHLSYSTSSIPPFM